MDDECVEELGRPISSLKVIELRDELTRRALIKTGNKKELIDRLRAAIQRQVSQSSSLEVPQAQQQLHYQQPTHDLDETPIVHQEEQNQTLDLSSTAATLDTTKSPQLVNSPALQQETAQDTPQLELENSNSIQKSDIETTLPTSEVIEEIPKLEESILNEKQSVVESTPEQQQSLVETSAGEEQVIETTFDERKSVAATSLHEEQAADETTSDRQQSVEDGNIEKDKDQSKAEVESEPTNTLMILNLVRPFTVGQLKNVLSEHGPIKEDKFWTDKVKSKCCVVYESVEVARQVRTSLHGQQWPSSNPKTLSITYVCEKTFAQCLESELTSESATEKGSENSADLKKDQANKSVTTNSGQLRGNITDDTCKIIESQISSNVECSKPSKDAELVETNIQEEQAAAEIAPDKQQSVKDDSLLKDKEQSQPEEESEPTNTLMILNLVRPFTVAQLKGVLSKYGPIKEDKFWTDKVKSKCCVVYESVEVAQQIRTSLHGQQWPSSNPKTLSITYVCEETFLQCQQSELDKETSLPKKPENGDLKKDQASKSIISRLGERHDGITDGTGTETVKKRLGERASDDLHSKLCNMSGELGSATPRKLDDLFKKTKTVPHLFWKPGPGLDKSQTSIKPLTGKLRESLDSDHAVRESECPKPLLKKRLGERASGDDSAKQVIADRNNEAIKSRNLDDLFKKTNSVPHIFWMPLTEDQADARQKARQERSERTYRDERIC